MGGLERTPRSRESGLVVRALGVQDEKKSPPHVLRERGGWVDAGVVVVGRQEGDA